jgi:YVTN family beta-propeller protein
MTVLRSLVPTTLLLALLGLSFQTRARQDNTATRIPLATGKFISPLGAQTDVGSYPTTTALSPDGKYVAVSSLGTRSQITLLDSTTGQVVSKVVFDGKVEVGKRLGVYMGLAFSRDGKTLYASGGSNNVVHVLTVLDGGQLRLEKTALGSGKGTDFAGISLVAGGKLLCVAENTADNTQAKMTSFLSILSTEDGSTVGRVPLPGYPLAVATLTNLAYVTSEQTGTVSVVDTLQQKELTRIATGAQPMALLLNRAQTELFVANAGSDTISVIDTVSQRVKQTILVRPAGARGIPNATPTAMALSPDEQTLYVTCADLNAVAVINIGDRRKNTVKGFIPTGWYPTHLTLSQDGKRLFVANAKGVGVRNPNADKRYVLTLLEGTVSVIETEKSLASLPLLTRQVAENNRLDSRNIPLPNLPKEIEHVVYIVKENRTYDQVLSDLPRGNNDASLLLFGRDITPNQHALAERFVQLDNFYCAAEVSGDGWNFSTGGMVSEYVSRNVIYGYTGHTRPYDYEGTNNGLPVDRLDINDAGRPAGGYIWDKALAKKRTVKNFGMFAYDFDNPRQMESEGDGSKGDTVQGVKKALANVTVPDFRQYDLAYADSDAWVEHGLSAAPKQLARFHEFSSRVAAWKKTYAELVATKQVPHLMLVRFGRNHTAGTASGQYSPRAMVADNDYAVGQLVETISNSPYWKKTAIFVVEDDAQAGYDHVDAHRSIAFVISPYIAQNTLDSRFYNTDSVLRTMGLFLHSDPMTLYDATAPVFDIFGKTPDNSEPYKAILPAKQIIGEINQRNAYRSKDSERLINLKKEESEPDEELNDILWHAIKGANTPTPRKRYGIKD